MLIFGYLGEANVINKFLGVLIGFIPFLIYYFIIYVKYAVFTEDGLKMFWIDVDEAGKTKEVEVDERHKVLVPCVAQGNRAVIGGLLGYPSTVGEMEKKGGMAYFRLAKLSHWQYRDITGQTASGLMNFYFPSYDGLEGYIDEYGDTVIETPEKPVRGIDGKLIRIGSKNALLSKRQALLEAEDIEAVMSAFIPMLKALSMLPFKAEDYKQLPEEEISEEEYENMIKSLKHIDWKTQTIVEGTDEKYCDGDKCERRP